MGAANSNLRRCLEDEFHRLAKQGRDYLVLDEVLSLRLPPSFWTLNTSHLGVLFVLDSNHDGRVTLAELLALADAARGRARAYQPYEFQAMMQGFCTLQLWRAVSAEGGREAFVDWVCRLLVENSAGQREEARPAPGPGFLYRDTIETLHHIFNVQETQGMDFQTFFDALQRCGEEAALMDLADEALDDWLPLVVVRQFLGSLNAGMQKVMEGIYPTTELEVAA